jgi:predicted transcriptional regulator
MARRRDTAKTRASLRILEMVTAMATEEGTMAITEVEEEKTNLGKEKNKHLNQNQKTLDIENLIMSVLKKVAHKKPFFWQIFKTQKTGSRFSSRVTL